MRVFLAATLTVALAACGSSEPETTAAPVTDTAADAPVAEQAPAETEAAPVLAAVEESDGSYDPEAVAEEGALRMARDDTPAVPQRFKEGVHYKRFRPAKLTVEGGPTVEVAEVFDGYTLARCSPRTGRTHQIRVHMTEFGHPLIGDPLYGGPTKARIAALQTDTKDAVRLFPRQALHAGDHGFEQTKNSEWLKIASELQ